MPHGLSCEASTVQEPFPKSLNESALFWPPQGPSVWMAPLSDLHLTPSV